jgi:hypothetical protein
MSHPPAKETNSTRRRAVHGDCTPAQVAPISALDTGKEGGQGLTSLCKDRHWPGRTAGPRRSCAPESPEPRTASCRSACSTHRYGKSRAHLLLDIAQREEMLPGNCFPKSICRGSGHERSRTEAGAGMGAYLRRRAVMAFSCASSALSTRLVICAGGRKIQTLAATSNRSGAVWETADKDRRACSEGLHS